MHTVAYVIGSTTSCSFEDCVLNEMCQSILFDSLITRTGIDYKATIRHITSMRIMYYLQAIG